MFASLDENAKNLASNPHMHLVLLMDFDYKFESRMAKFQQAIAGQSYQNRVFLFGVDNKEFENLKQTLKQTNVERIGQMLVEDCPQQQTPIWQNQHLNCNQTEIQRIRNAGVFQWLFK